MKLEKVVSRPKVGLWVALFILGLLVAGVLATSYNVELVHRVDLEGLPIGKIIFGSLGFIGIISAFILFFARLLREMKISQVQADFLDRISHELRTPLSTLTLVSDLLRQEEKDESPEVKKLWTAHSLELERLRTDVELLLQAARLRESRLKVNLEPVQIKEFFESRWESFKTLLGPSAELTLKGEAIDRPALLDPPLFELIFRNLLDNARKFAHDHAVVEIELKRLPAPFFFGKSRFRITVQDHGMGFSPEQSKALFKRFSRLEESNERPHSIPGTGLGLYLSASAAKAMELKLHGESLGNGKGARFSVEGYFV